MKIEVTAEDIRYGVPRSNCSCPIARAVKRTRQAYHDVSVGSQDIEIDGKGYLLPLEAIGFICDFDTDKPVAPFSFETLEQP